MFFFDFLVFGKLDKNLLQSGLAKTVFFNTEARFHCNIKGIEDKSWFLKKIRMHFCIGKLFQLAQAMLQGKDYFRMDWTSFF